LIARNGHRALKAILSIRNLGTALHEQKLSLESMDLGLPPAFSTLLDCRQCLG
jgi:hypothetical protein